MKVDIKELPEMRVATLAHVGPYNQIGDAFMRLAKIAGAAGLIGPALTMLGIYYDDPRSTPPEKLRSAAGITIAADAKVPAGTTETRVPAGRYAATTHVGPYDQLPDVWNRFAGELGKLGPRGKGASLEIYRNTPDQVPVEQLITELYVPLA